MLTVGIRRSETHSMSILAYYAYQRLNSQLDVVDLAVV